MAWLQKTMAIADAVLQRNAPLPAALWAVDRVYGAVRSSEAQGTATARSQGSQWLQSSNPRSALPRSAARGSPSNR